MKKIAILNQKGGTGKTTSTINIAGELAQRGYKVLIVDADSQGNASQNLGMYDPEKPSIADVMLKKIDVNEAILQTAIDNIDIVPSTLELQYAEMNLQQKVTRNDNVFKKAMAALNNDYDFVIVDCSPSLSTMTVNVLVYVDYVLIPIKTDRNSLEGYNRLENLVNVIKEDSNEALSILGVFLTVFEKQTVLDKTIYEECKKGFKDTFIDIPIRKNIEVREAPMNNLPVCIYKKTSTGAKDYKELTDEILKRLGE